jgi:hypothetical protein
MKKRIIFYLLIFFLPLITFFSLEIIARFYVYYVNKNLCAIKLNVDKYSGIYSKDLGYIPASGLKFGCFGEKYTINNSNYRTFDGYEFNKSTTLITGDSFGFGDEVSDNETVGYFLYKKYDTQSTNIAVFGYGIDQALLRANIFSKINNNKFKKIILIISPGSYPRILNTVRNSIYKPYYTAHDGSLQLNLPTEKKFKHSSRDKLYQKSILIDYVIRTLNLNLQQNIFSSEKDEIELGCKIIEKFNNEFKYNKIDFVIVMYREGKEIFNIDKKYIEKTESYINCFKKNNIKYFDTKEVLSKSIKNKIYTQNTYGHPTKLANEIVADLIGSKK